MPDLASRLFTPNNSVLLLPYWKFEQSDMNKHSVNTPYSHQGITQEFALDRHVTKSRSLNTKVKPACLGTYTLKDHEVMYVLLFIQKMHGTSSFNLNISCSVRVSSRQCYYFSPYNKLCYCNKMMQRPSLEYHMSHWLGTVEKLL